MFRTDWKLVRVAVTALIVALATAGCGDRTDSVELENGLIISDPICQESSGQFELLLSEGSVLFIFLDAKTRLALADGEAATCTDLSRNDHVQVRGIISGQSITAESITLQ